MEIFLETAAYVYPDDNWWENKPLTCLKGRHRC